MKKNTASKLEYEYTLREQRERRQGKNSVSRRRRKKNLRSVLKIIAPETIDIYKSKNHTKLVEFLSKVRLHVGIEGKSILICFRNTRLITAAAGILLLAEIDRLVQAGYQNKINATRPNPISKGKAGKDHTVQAVLNQIGFFKLLGKAEYNLPKAKNVECWGVDSGLLASGEAANTMISKLEQHLPAGMKKNLYRGALEALANSVEHGYRGGRNDGLGIKDKRWWMFTAVQDNKLVILVCDLGVGIPNTIRDTQPDSLIQQIFAKFSFFANTDGSWIKVATLVKETRTGLTNRGKGGSDLRSIVDKFDKATLTIISNKGQYNYRKHKLNSGKVEPTESVYDNKRSILGTIVQWSIEAEQLNHDDT